MRSARTTLLCLAAAMALALTACGGDDNLDGDSGGDSGSESKGSLTVGAANFTEGQVMAEMYAILLEDAGYSVSVETVDNRELYEPALEKGEIDVVPEYAATFAEFLNLKVNGADADLVASPDLDETMTALTDLAEQQGLEVLEPAEAVDQNAFAVTQEYAEQNDLTTMSDMGANVDKPVVLAATEECPDRPFCQPGLEDVYGIEIAELQPLGFDTPQVKEALQSGDAQLGLVATTDGTLGDDGLVTLEDDKNLQNADNLVPVVNPDSAGGKDVADALNALAPVLTTEDLADLNRQVDVERAEPEDAAREYLEQQSLL
ncbi:MAG: ABC transporter substrate-binding protein [Actinomycetes bacterium]